MGFLDSILKPKPKEQKPKEQIVEPVDKKPQIVQAQVQKEDKKPLDLTKKIALNFEKLNLHKEDVRKKRLFLLDISGSMGERSGEKRKIDHLRSVMTPYTDAKMVCFSSNISKVSDAKFIPDPDGGTNLAKAFKYIKTDVIEKPERVVLVSDGQPDSEKDALEQAKILSLPIDIIFIGEKESKGYDFMQRLASATGGQEFQVT